MNDKIKLNYGRTKIIIITILQNIIIIESLVLQLNHKYLTFYTTIINIILLIIFVIFDLYYHYDFNYNTKTNYLINILSIFCFFSVFFGIISYYIDYKIESYVTLFFYTVCITIFSFCFYNISQNLYVNKMISLLKNELFKIYNDKNILENHNYNCFYYFNDIFKTIKDNNGKDENTEILVNIILLHQSKCNHAECKCKYIEIFPYGEEYVNDYIINFLKNIEFLLESTFVELEYLQNYDLTLLLSEHYYNHKNNPILAFSMIQTLLQFNIKSLNINQILILYTALNKYKEKCNNINEIIFSNKNSEELEEKFFKGKKIKLFKTFFTSYKYLIKAKKIMKKYANDMLQLVKYKEAMEETIQLEKDENNDIKKITSSFLSSKNINKIKNILLGEFMLKKSFLKYLIKIDANKIPFEMIYKCVLFSDLFF